MSVGIKVGSIIDEIGTSDFFHAFFSTVSGNLEPGWGMRFPALMNKLYQGELQQQDADAALVELAEAEQALSKLPPSRVVWNFEDRSKQPPWGKNIAPTITSLANYFVTSTGRDLLSTLREAIQALKDEGGAAQIVRY